MVPRASRARRAAERVVAATSGNHGQALAFAARALGTRCVIVAPEGSNPLKLHAARAYGASVVQEGVTTSDREVVADELARRHGYARNQADDPEGVAGLATIGEELLEQAPKTQVILVPVGLGALVSGVAIAVTQQRPEVRVIGVEPVLAADAAASLKSGQLQSLSRSPETLADGVRLLPGDPAAVMAGPDATSQQMRFAFATVWISLSRCST